MPAWHKDRVIYLVVHGDDFMVTAEPDGMAWMDQQLSEAFEIKIEGRVGPAELGGRASGQFLRRTIGWTSAGYSWTGDPAHAQKIIEMCGGGRAASQREISHGSKHPGKGIRTADDELEHTEIKEYQYWAATALYLAGDRIDIQTDVSILMQAMSKPRVVDKLRLARLAAYLTACPQMTCFYPYGDFPDKIYCEVDADWAGDLETRRSRDGGYEFFGTYLLDGWTCIQQTVALSTGESELYAICNGAARGLWTRALFEEMGFGLTVEVGTHSSAARGITARLGCGRLRHLETRFLWIQEKVREKLIHIVNIGTATNRADLQTKALELWWA